MKYQIKKEYFSIFILRSFSLFFIFVSLSIVFILLIESKFFFEKVSWIEFFFTTEWSPLVQPKTFGLIPLLWDTIFLAIFSCCLSLPLGLGVGIYLSQYADLNVRNIVKPLIELLAGIPSIVFGFFALNMISPLIRSFYPDAEIFQVTSAACVVAIMTLPLVASLCDDAFRAVPQSLLHGGYALGATKAEVCLSILIPYASSGVIASFVLAFSRAVGETMAVTLAAGSTPKITVNPFDSIQTMTSYIVQVGTGDTSHESLEYQSLFAVGLVLFGFTLTANTVAQFLKRYFFRGSL